MSNPVETIGELAVAAIMFLVMILVLGTLGGADPSSLSAIVEAATNLIVYLTIIAIFGAILFGILSEIV